MIEKLPYNLLVFLDAIHLYYLPEKHCLPAYGYQGKPKAEKKEQEQPQSERKVRAGFRAKEEEENEEIQSVWVAEKYDKETAIQEHEIKELNKQGLSLDVAKIVKQEKVLNNLSNRAIVAKHHTKGQSDGFSKGTVDKIAAIVAPSTDRGVKS